MTRTAATKQKQRTVYLFKKKRKKKTFVKRQLHPDLDLGLGSGPTASLTRGAATL